MEVITRKSLLYKSGLGIYCINHVQGCSHGCKYPCYAYMMAQSYNQMSNYDEWCKPKIVINAPDLIAKKLKSMRKRPDIIHLCLSTDPFMYGYPEVTGMSLKLIEIINSFNIKCSILTKGILSKELGDKAKFCSDNIYGISLVSVDENFRKRYEPGASPYDERIKALKCLHENGNYTLVHMEPYPTPNILKQNLEEILERIGFINQLFFGGWNYNNHIKEYKGSKIFYKEQSKVAESFCKSHGIMFESGYM